MGRVVGAAIVRAGAVLAARRTRPASMAGRWEFPGGKVEPGETPDEALEREIAEELGCRIEVRHWLAGSVPIGTEHELRVAVAALHSGEPHPTEHDLLRWLGPDELDDVDWLEPDRPFLAELRGRLVESEPLLRGIVFEQADASAVAERLGSAGYEARVVRETLAGEDDDEDHPWAVLTDAPQLQLELLLDEFDGWLDLPTAPTVAPLELPTAPRRIKNPPH